MGGESKNVVYLPSARRDTPTTEGKIFPNSLLDFLTQNTTKGISENLISKAIKDRLHHNNRNSPIPSKI